MKFGAKLTGRTCKKHFHIVFGSVGAITDFNVDSGLQMPNQNTDQAETECTNYTTTDLATDIDKQIYSPDWGYAQTLRMEGSEPTTEGADPLTAMEVGISQGFLPRASVSLTASNSGELFCANYKNWPTILGTLALKWTKIDVYNALGNGTSFYSVLSASVKSGRGVSVATNWYPEWEQIGPNGILPMPASLSESSTGHNYAVKGQKTIEGKTYWIVKSWQGSSYGDGGWCYMSQEIANAVMGFPGSVAFLYAPSGNQWVARVKIMLQHLTAIPYLLPILNS